MRDAYWLPLLALLLLGAVCTLRGQAGIAGMAHPPDQDILRDIGLMQGILDGNWFGDPVYPGELRWYPPVIPALGAALAWLIDADPARVWLQAGPWLTLAAFALFVAMTHRLLGLTQAVVAAAIYVLVDSAIGRPWVTGGYTPWAFTPSVSAGLFFGSVWLIHDAARQRRWRDAVLVGAALGIVALAHTVPALLLSFIVSAAAVAQGGVRVRTIAWLAIVAVLQVALMLLFVWPLWLQYRLHIANPAPGGYVTDMLRPAFGWFAALLNLAGLSAASAILLMCRHAPLAPPTGAILAAWIAAPGIMLTRHYVCQGFDLGAACRVFVVAAHHWQLYLVYAWTLVAAQAIVGAGALLRARSRLAKRETMAIGLTIAAVAIGVVLAAGIGDPTATTRSPTQDIRAWASLPGRETDWQARDWIRLHTPPGAMFVTDGSEPAAFSVIPAGRALVAAPLLHANPYVDWPSREARRQALMAKLAGAGPPGTCGQFPGWALLPDGMVIDPERAQPFFRTPLNTIYRLGPDCPP